MQLPELEEWLDSLRDHGVTHFSCPEFTVTLGALPQEVVDDDDVSVNEAIRQAAFAENAPRAAKGVFGDPRLWPNGKPPSFPGSERATPDHKPTHPDDED